MIWYYYNASTLNMSLSCAANCCWRHEGHSIVEPIVVGALKAIWRLYFDTDTPSISRTITPHTPSLWRALKQACTRFFISLSSRTLFDSGTWWVPVGWFGSWVVWVWLEPDLRKSRAQPLCNYAALSLQLGTGGVSLFGSLSPPFVLWGGQCFLFIARLGAVRK